MKKIGFSLLTAATLFASAATASDSGLYAGVDLIKSNNDFKVKVSGTGSASDTFSNDAVGFKFKFGAMGDEGLRFQGYFMTEKFDDPLYDADHDRMYEIGVDLIKGFEVSSQVEPFIQGGLGFGWIDVDDSVYDSSVSAEISLRFGAGVAFHASPVAEFLLGVDYQFRTWSDAEITTPTEYYKVELDDHGPRFYIGANYHF